MSLFNRKPTQRTAASTLAVLSARPSTTHEDEIAKFYRLQAQIAANRNPQQDAVKRENDARFANWK